jgi:hypothetical protein
VGTLTALPTTGATLQAYQLAGAQGINRALRHIADQIDLGEEEE